MSFGFSPSDISTCIQLAIKFKKKYSGSSSELQGVIDDLEGFEVTRDQIRAFSAKFPTAPFAVVLQRQAERLDSAIEKFRKEVSQYEPSLGPSSLLGPLRTIPAKARYAIFSELKDLKITFQQQWVALLVTIASQNLAATVECSSEIQSLTGAVEKLGNSITGKPSADSTATQVSLLEPHTSSAEPMPSILSILDDLKGGIQRCKESMSFAGITEQQQTTVDEIRQHFDKGLGELMESQHCCVTSASGQDTLVVQRSNEHPIIEGLSPSSLSTSMPTSSLSAPAENTLELFVTTLDCKEYSVSSAVEAIWTSSWPTKHPVRSCVGVCYNIRWELEKYCSDFFPQGTQLFDVASFTGTPKQAFYGSCGEYLISQWPRIGKLLVEALQVMLTTGQRGEAHDIQSGATITVEQVRERPRAKVNTGQSEPVVASQHPLCETTCKMLVTGNWEVQVDCSCAILWVSATLRSSTYREMVSSGATMRRRNRPEVGPLYMDIELSPLQAFTEQSCWTILGQRSVLVSGFPIPEREGGEGLEISFRSMCKLARCTRLIHHDGGLVGVGILCVVQPMFELSNGRGIQWHILERQRLAVGKSTEPEHQPLESYTETLHKISSQEWHRSSSLEALESRRVYLGWVDCVTVLSGTASAPPTSPGTSTLPLAEVKQPHILFYSMSEDRGDSMTKLPVHALGTLTMVEEAKKELIWSLKRLSSTPIVLYDTADQRAWLLDGASALLHLVRTSLNMSGSKLRKEDQTILEYSGGDVFSSSSKALINLLDFPLFGRDDSATGAAFDLVEEMWLRFSITEAKLQSTKAEASKPGKTAPKMIYGVEFLDLALQNAVIAQKEARVDQGWAKLTEGLGAAIVLFGKHYGEVIRPSRPDSICNYWQSLPTGRNYLAATGQAILNILSSQQLPDGSTRLGEQIHWQQSRLLFDKCKTSCSCDRLQSLIPVMHQPRERGLFETMEPLRHGAVIFGKKKSRLTWPSSTTSKSLEDQTKNTHEGTDLVETESTSSSAVTPDLSIKDSLTCSNTETDGIDDPPVSILNNLKSAPEWVDASSQSKSLTFFTEPRLEADSMN